MEMDFSSLIVPAIAVVIALVIALVVVGCVVIGGKLKGRSRKETTRLCPQCGKAVKEGKKFCTSCGAKME